MKSLSFLPYQPIFAETFNGTYAWTLFDVYAFFHFFSFIFFSRFQEIRICKNMFQGFARTGFARICKNRICKNMFQFCLVVSSLST